MGLDMIDSKQNMDMVEKETNSRNSLVFTENSISYDGTLIMLPERIWGKIITELGNRTNKGKDEELSALVEQQKKEIEELKQKIANKSDVPMMLKNQQAEIENLTKEVDKRTALLNGYQKKIKDLSTRLEQAQKELEQAQSQESKSEVKTVTKVERDERFEKNIGNADPARASRLKQTELLYKAIIEQILKINKGDIKGKKATKLIGNTVVVQLEKPRYTSKGRQNKTVPTLKTVSKSTYYRAIQWYNKQGGNING